MILSAMAVALLAPSHSGNTSIAAKSDGDLAPGTAGMKAYLDPETGELTMGVPPAAEFELDADTRNALRRDTDGLEVVKHADGSESIDLQGRFESISVVHIDENGKAIICTDNVQTAQKSLGGKTSSTTPEVK
jgi:hypothetical protein